MATFVLPGGMVLDDSAAHISDRGVVAVSCDGIAQQDGLVQFFRRYQPGVEYVTKPFECKSDYVVQFNYSVQTPRRIPYLLASYQWTSLLPIRWTR